MIQCTRCERHYRMSEEACPFCSRRRPLVNALNAVGGVVTTVVLAACYGGSGYTPIDTGPFTNDTGDTDVPDTGDTAVDTAGDTGGDTATPTDNDNDGFPSDVDCNDDDPAINPGQAEVCDDGVDNDCDTLVDGADPDC